MLKEAFVALKEQGFNRIPVSRRILADVDTPVSTFLKLAEGPYSYLFESVQGGEKWGRYSILGLPCSTVLKVFGQQVQILDSGVVQSDQCVDDPLAFIEQYRKQYKLAPVDGLPPFQGGLVGYFAYDTVRYVEKRLADSVPHDELGTADIVLMVSEQVVVFDNLTGVLHLIVIADAGKDDAYEQAQALLDEQVSKMQQALKQPELLSVADASDKAIKESDFVSGFKEDEFKAAVEKIKEYVLDGDTMQVVLSQRLSIDFDAKPLNLYRALRNLNPSPYMYYLDLGDTHVVGSSPEILAKLSDGEVSVRPIAGTRRRGYTEQEDLALEKELLADPKEIAEHLMLIDLGRNDVGRISKTGTVELTDKMSIERYSHVMHIVSHVKAQVRDDVSAMDVLKATLPAGTLSGAPKVRAMEIIDQLEPVKRGIYGGAVGYLSWQGDMDTAIAIRTAVIKDKKLYVQAGAGVVADSIPDLEWKETMNKARAVMRAVAIAATQKEVS